MMPVIDKATATVIRGLAKRYVEVCESDRNRRLRELWRDHNSLVKTRPLVICSWHFASCIDGEIDLGGGCAADLNRHARRNRGSQSDRTRGLRTGGGRDDNINRR